MPKLRDIFDLPEQVHQGDFVLRLTDGLNAPAETVRDYVATPQLVKCFDQALGVVKSAIDSRTSKGACLTTYQFASNPGITAFQPIPCICKSNT